jgi:hypothetical protein
MSGKVLRRLGVLSIALAGLAVASGEAAAQAVPPDADVNGKTVFLRPGAWLRYGESLVSKRYMVDSSRGLTLVGRGKCGKWACPVTHDNQQVFARLSNLGYSVGTAPGPSLPQIIVGKAPKTEPARAVGGGAVAIGGKLRRGDRGEDVRQVQEALLRRRYLGVTIDGVYGRSTEAAIRRFQRRERLKIDGVVGEQTRARLLSA